MSSLANMSFELDDLWLEKLQGFTSLTLQQKRRLYRVLTVAVVGASYLVDITLLSLFSVAGTIDGFIPLFYASAALGHVLIFSALHWSGFSDSLPNPHMTLWQMIYAIGVIIVGITLSPQITQYYLGILLVVFCFGTLRVSLKQMLAAWVTVCLMVAGTMIRNGHSTLGIIDPTQVEVMLIGIAFASILLRTVGLGYYATALRMRLYEKTHSLELQACYDELTGALNRSAIMPMIEDTITLKRRKQISACIAMIDIDFFKHVNDRFGHLVGDQVLKRITDEITAHTRDVDKLCRYGGEEFVLLMPATDLDEGRHIVTRLNQGISAIDWRGMMEQKTITVSCGIAEVGEQDSIDTLIERADHAMYTAKRAGRNRVYPAEHATENVMMAAQMDAASVTPD